MYWGWERKRWTREGEKEEKVGSVKIVATSNSFLGPRNTSFAWRSKKEWTTLRGCSRQESQEGAICRVRSVVNRLNRLWKKEKSMEDFSMKFQGDFTNDLGGGQVTGSMNWMCFKGYDLPMSMKKLPSWQSRIWSRASGEKCQNISFQGFLRMSKPQW